MSSFFRLTCLLVVAVSVLPALANDKKPAETEQMSNLHFNVVKDDNNKPVRNASVILHPVNKDGSQGKGGYQLKTDNAGNTATEGIPYGKIRVQVLAPGMQTFGDDYDVNQPDMDIHIRLKRPTDQFSSYDKPPKDANQSQPAPPPSTPKPN